MRESVLSQAQTSLLERFAAIGGCVDYILLDTEPPEDVRDRRIHRRAAVLGLETVQRRFVDYARRTSREKNIPIAEFFAVTIDYERAEEMEGRRISWKEFLGARYDHGRKGLLLRGHNEPFLNSLIFYADPESPDAVVPLEDEASERGYSYAFSDPPYGLRDWSRRSRVSRREIGEFFESINREILGGITRETVIYEWPHDWSNYFEAGQDWWGSFFWTVANPGVARIAVIGASTTD